MLQRMRRLVKLGKLVASSKQCVVSGAVTQTLNKGLQKKYGFANVLFWSLARRRILMIYGKRHGKYIIVVSSAE